MFWWVNLPSRARSERAAIAELEDQSAWLGNVRWGFESDCRLFADFVIRHLGDEFPLKLIFPSFFPDTPPQVVPRENIRLSDHQWGVGGELCLEIRADNWDPSFTGAMMIESAYKLLSGERPAAEETAAVASAHRVSQDQSIRGKKTRFLITPEERGAFERYLSAGEETELALSEHESNKHWLMHPTRLGPQDEPLWEQSQRVLDAKSRFGFAIRLPSSVTVPSSLDDDGLRTFLASVNASQTLDKLDTDRGELNILFVGDTTCKLVCTFLGKERRLVLPYTTVEFPENRNRLSENYANLADKAVAVIGCGSMGSKIAVSLARSGVKRFVIVDEEILNPDNLVRNDLDARAVGMHKTNAVAARLQEVNSNADVVMWRIELGGQESAASTDSALTDVAACDLIIDATANSQVFNLCSAVARREHKPMVWGEVFAGGIGGLIARARPDLEPPPHAARRQLAAWCDQKGVPWEGRSESNYEFDQADAEPLIADDSDVTVIASNLTRLALDTLLRGTDSQFPYSAYAIGLTNGWIFSAPFDTEPIEFSAEGSWEVDKDPDAAYQLATLIGELLPNGIPESDAT